MAWAFGGFISVPLLPTLVRRRAWVGIGLLAAGLGIALLGQALPPAAQDNLYLVGAIAVLAGIVVLLSQLTVWRKLAGPPLPPMPDLFARLGPNRRWCTRCGRAAPAQGPCASCGALASAQRRQQRRLQRKQRARPQEKKTQDS